MPVFSGSAGRPHDPGAPQVIVDTWRHRLGLLVVLSTLGLIFAGGLVTSLGCGLSVPDWPLSYGMWMPPMVGCVFYEHGHRMIASSVGFLTLVLAVWTARREPRAGVRRLAWAALGAVVAQGVLGGLTVIYLLPTAVSVAHACLAQTFFCMMIALVFATSREGIAAGERAEDVAGVRPAAGFATALVYVQLFLGALMRHMGAGLAIPDFPLAFGQLLPPFTSAGIAVHFAHRVGALLVLASIAVLYARCRRSGEPSLLGPARFALGLVLVQIGLGATAVLSAKATTPTTLHVATGAALLGSCWFLALRSLHRLRPGVPAAVLVAPLAGGSVAQPWSTPALAAIRTAGSDYLELTKPRITFLVTLTALVGFVMASPGGVSPAGLTAALVGTALVAGGASAMNMLLERQTDARMRRTERRPLPAGRLRPWDAGVFGLLLTAAGLLELLWLSQPLAAVVAFATWASYVFLYTPLKRRTSLSTLVGAVPGALPPVIGWTAARGSFDPGAFMLFAILFLWQIPHFLAIAWIYREDYERGGLPMLPVLDPSGRLTGRQAVAHSLALLVVSVAPSAAGLAGRVYLVGAVMLGVGLTAVAVRAAVVRTTQAARGLFLASVLYLAGLCTLLIVDRL